MVSYGIAPFTCVSTALPESNSGYSRGNNKIMQKERYGTRREYSRVRTLQKDTYVRTSIEWNIPWLSRNICTVLYCTVLYCTVLRGEREREERERTTREREREQLKGVAETRSLKSPICIYLSAINIYSSGPNQREIIIICTIGPAGADRGLARTVIRIWVWYDMIRIYI